MSRYYRKGNQPAGTPFILPGGLSSSQKVQSQCEKGRKRRRGKEDFVGSFSDSSLCSTHWLGRKTGSHQVSPLLGDRSSPHWLHPWPVPFSNGPSIFKASPTAWTLMPSDTNKVSCNGPAKGWHQHRCAGKRGRGAAWKIGLEFATHLLWASLGRWWTREVLRDSFSLGSAHFWACVQSSNLPLCPPCIWKASRQSGRSCVPWASVSARSSCSRGDTGRHECWCGSAHVSSCWPAEWTPAHKYHTCAPSHPAARRESRLRG